MAFNRRQTFAMVVPVLTLLLAPVSVYATTSYNLDEMMTNNYSLFSSDGSVKFTDFAYIPTVGAPDAVDILVSQDPVNNPQGFKVHGESFLAENGESFSVYIGCEAELVDQVNGDLLEADLRNLVADTFGTFSSALGSSAKVNVKVDSLDKVINPALLAVLASEIGSDVLSDNKSLAGFGKNASVLMGISVFSVPGVTGAKAEISEFAVNFSNVPEPTTGIVLLSLAGLAAIRRR